MHVPFHAPIFMGYPETTASSRRRVTSGPSTVGGGRRPGTAWGSTVRGLRAGHGGLFGILVPAPVARCKGRWMVLGRYPDLKPVRMFLNPRCASWRDTMSLHGTTGNGVSKAATPQGSATAHTTLPAWATAYPTAGSPPLCAASTTLRSSPSWRSERLRRRGLPIQLPAPSVDLGAPSGFRHDPSQDVLHVSLSGIGWESNQWRRRCGGVPTWQPET